jgi:PIN domain nuclease of toxin-antitoxin system
MQCRDWLYARNEAFRKSTLIESRDKHARYDIADHRLSPAAHRALEDGQNTLVLHQASIWEIQLKYQKGQLQLSESPRTFIPKALRLHQIDCATFENDAIWHIEKLPEHHKDPFDRILIAAALCKGMKIVTPDPIIGRYPVPVLW